MNYFSESDEEKFAGWWDIRFHHSTDVENMLFAFEYQNPELWNDVLEDIKEFGLEIGDYMTVPPKLGMDAIKCGMIAPFLAIYEDVGEYVDLRCWSVLRHSYMDIDEMFDLELKWFFDTLINKIWSYN